MTDRTDRAQALAPLDVLVGEWALEARFDGAPPPDGTARATFDWMPGGQFLVQRWTAPDPAPDGIAVIGLAPAGHEGPFLQHYFDTRGVARVYQLWVEERTITFLREKGDFSPLDFHQRYVGAISEDGSSIDGAWEMRRPDGSGWEKDFELSYRRER